MTYAQQQAALRKRNARIRYQMLAAIHTSRTNQHGGWITGRGVVEALAWCAPDIKPDDDGHAEGLLMDLTLAGYIDSEDNREDRSQPQTIDYFTYRVTDKGVGFINRTEPADGRLDDGRILKPKTQGR